MKKSITLATLITSLVLMPSLAFALAGVTGYGCDSGGGSDFSGSGTCMGEGGGGGGSSSGNGGGNGASGGGGSATANPYETIEGYNYVLDAQNAQQEVNRQQSQENFRAVEGAARNLEVAETGRQQSQEQFRGFEFEARNQEAAYALGNAENYSIYQAERVLNQVVPQASNPGFVSSIEGLEKGAVLTYKVDLKSAFIEPFEVTVIGQDTKAATVEAVAKTIQDKVNSEQQRFRSGEITAQNESANNSQENFRQSETVARNQETSTLQNRLSSVITTIRSTLGDAGRTVNTFLSSGTQNRSETKDLQNFLVANGNLSKDAVIDQSTGSYRSAFGDYGRNTMLAVQSFQREEGLQVNGTTDAATRERMNCIITNTCINRGASSSMRTQSNAVVPVIATISSSLGVSYTAREVVVDIKEFSAPNGAITLTWGGSGASACTLNGINIGTSGTRTFTGLVNDGTVHVYECINGQNSGSAQKASLRFLAKVPAVAAAIAPPAANQIRNTVNTTTASNDDGDDATTVSGSCITIKNTLAPGSKDAKTNGEVTLLQQFLKDKGFMSINPTGNWGTSAQSKTTAAVKAYQASKGKPQVARVGALTKSLIYNDTCTSEVAGD